MTNKTTMNTFTTSIEKFEKSAKIGWWESDQIINNVTLSDYLVDLFKLDSRIVHLSTIIGLVLPEYKRTVLLELAKGRKNSHFDHTFPMRTHKGIAWMKLVLSGEEQQNNDKTIIYGFAQQVDAPISDNKVATRKNEKEFEIDKDILSSLYDSFPVGLELYDKDGILVWLNNKDVEMFGGNTKEDILGINIFDHPILLPELKEKMRNREYIDFTSTFDCSLLQGYYKSKKHHVFDLTTKISNLCNEKGELTHYVFTNIDEANSVSVYQRIQEFESHFAMISEFAKTGYSKWNPLKNEGFAIAQWFKNLDRPVINDMKDILEQYCNVYPPDLVDITEFYNNVLNGKAKSLSKEVRIFRKNGETRWLRCFQLVKAYDPENDYIEVIGMNFDITQLKETEQKLTIAKEKAEAADNIKSRFLANMSHEIRTPLNAIIGFSDVLTEEHTDCERDEYMTLIKKNSDLLLKLIDDILDLSKIEAGKYEFTPVDIEINSLCQNAVNSINVTSKKGVAVLFKNNSAPFMLKTDKDRLTQVINNLLNNAKKFTKEGTVELFYEVEEKQVKFFVKDTGCGIEEKHIQTIFERFEKLNPFVQGTGLGLSICKQIIEKMDGEIGVESEVGKGSTFWFTVPF